jgi:hypothetical protein
VALVPFFSLPWVPAFKTEGSVWIIVYTSNGGG